MIYIQRNITDVILKGLSTMPAVFINGPRQSGKSTLAKKIADETINADYVTFDDISTLSFAKSNPGGFLKSFNKPVVIDEVQLVPELFRHLKLHIDQSRFEDKKITGLFLLTGSSNILTLPELSEALVGRIQLSTLYPFSYCEINQNNFNFINSIFKTTNYFRKTYEEYNVADIICKATFPQVSLDRNLNSNSWFEGYINTLLFRDVRNISQIEKLHELPNLLQILASRVGGLLNDADLARSAGLNQMTLGRYRTLLQNVFLIKLIPPWYQNIGKRLVKSSKIYLTDTLLLAYLNGYDLQITDQSNPTAFGMILENFVATELFKQLSLLNDGRLFHFRTQDNKEVDFIIEKRNGDLIGIEVKNKTTVTYTDFKNLKLLESILHNKFIRGVVLYRGNKILPFEDKMTAMPISKLWTE